MSPSDLTQVLRHLPPITDSNVLVGMNTADDAAVYKVRDDLALAFTVDYFTPVVDDPYDFGAIAATNAMSDCYAMGVRPAIALNIVGFSTKTLPITVLDSILRGGSDKAAEAGVSIVGGHTIEDEDPKYGMAVVGFAHPDEVMTNAGAREGDVLVLTKPIGIGMITTAIKAEMITQESLDEAVRLMKTLNRDAASAMAEVGVHACTDVTGFGLLGHLWEMCRASGVGARVELGSVPVLAEAWEIAENGLIPGGAYSNRGFVSDGVSFDPGVSETAQLILCDPQTSGGLLMAVPPDKADDLTEALKSKGVPACARVGKILADPQSRIRVVE